MDQALKNLTPSWKKILQPEFSKDYFKTLTKFIENEYTTKTIYPKKENIFKALNLCPLSKVKVIIIGQDPYHGPNQANGLSFAVHKETKLPPSLKNIFTEIESDLHITPLQNGDLSRWAEQGVLLLNTTLTVQAQAPGSHQNKGWEIYTDAIIQKLSEEKEYLVFILWGNYAKKKGLLIDKTKHLVIESQHPSPFSAHRGFLGSKPFSKTNTYLKKHNQQEIDWK
jgi:uracil-DNA glycosylase